MRWFASKHSVREHTVLHVILLIAIINTWMANYFNLLLHVQRASIWSGGPELFFAFSRAMKGSKCKTLLMTLVKSRTQDKHMLSFFLFFLITNPTMTNSLQYCGFTTCKFRSKVQKHIHVALATVSIPHMQYHAFDNTLRQQDLWVFRCSSDVHAGEVSMYCQSPSSTLCR